MKKFISTLLTILMLLASLSITPIAADTETAYQGYLNDFAEKDVELGGVNSKVVILQIFDVQGIETIYECTSSIIINGITYSDTSSVIQALKKETYADFLLNEDGNVCCLNYTSNFPTHRRVNATLQEVLYETVTSDNGSFGSINANMHFNYVLDECLVIMALYNNSGVLLDCSWKPSPSFAADFNIAIITNTSYIGYPVKFFFWDYNTLKPLNTVLCGTVVRAESTPEYGYVNDIAITENDSVSTGYDIRLQLITTDGVQVAKLKPGAKLNVSDDYYETATAGDANTYGNTIILDTANWNNTDVLEGTYATNEYTKYETLKRAIVGQVIKYSIDNHDSISTITTEGYNKSAGSAADFSRAAISGNVTYSAESPRFVANDNNSTGGNAYDACTIFVVGDNISECQTAVLSDLVIGNKYDVLASYTEKPTGSANVIVISYDTFIDLGAQAYLAVISDVAEGPDADGNNIWTISYMLDYQEFLSETTSQVATGSRPTAGDVVKLGFNRYGLISSIHYVWDFDEGVRNFTTNEPLSLATGDETYIVTNPDETLAGGVVTAFDDSKDIATINGTEYKLIGAENVYAIDNTGRTLKIKRGAPSSFKYFPALYTTQGTITITDVDDDIIGTFDMSTQSYDAQKMADHVYLRTYEGRVEDIIIVKGADIRVSAN